MLRKPLGSVAALRNGLSDCFGLMGGSILPVVPEIPRCARDASASALHKLALRSSAALPLLRCPLPLPGLFGPSRVGLVLDPLRDVRARDRRGQAALGGLAQSA